MKLRPALVSLLAVAAVLPAEAAAAPPAKPKIVIKPIPYGAQRKADMRAYARRHYDLDTYRLVKPQVIVEHYTENSSFQATYNTFAPNRADPELHEKPGTCAHFVVDRNGRIYRLVPITIMCRHTVGLNYTAIGIEHVGTSDAGVLNNKRQMKASLRLTRWLLCTNQIEPQNVIGHAESLQSPFHKENVARLKTQTHGDFPRTAMNRYRARLARLGDCA